MIFFASLENISSKKPLEELPQHQHPPPSSPLTPRSSTWERLTSQRGELQCCTEQLREEQAVADVQPAAAVDGHERWGRESGVVKASVDLHEVVVAVVVVAAV